MGSWLLKYCAFHIRCYKYKNKEWLVHCFGRVLVCSYKCTSHSEVVGHGKHFLGKHNVGVFHQAREFTCEEANMIHPIMVT